MTDMNLEKLEVWKRAFDFAVIIYKVVLPKLPPEEKWNLNQQIRRSAQSIPANIAEGHGRFHYLDNVRFCYNARGSLTEVVSHLALACKLGYLSEEIYQKMSDQAESISKQLNNYIGYLKRTKQGEKEIPPGYTIREEQEGYFFDTAIETDDK